ncbi:MAG: hypothetical protein HYY04_04235 [Chloroflexi bacterium]|nr:hypothetical protein [Chloroflexota bacterium]
MPDDLVLAVDWAIDWSALWAGSLDGAQLIAAVMLVTFVVLYARGRWLLRGEPLGRESAGGSHSLPPFLSVAHAAGEGGGASHVAGDESVGPAIPAALRRLFRLADHAIEEGRSIHVSAGTGALGSPATADTLAGLVIVRDLARRAQAGGAPVIATSPDPMAHAVLRRIGDSKSIGTPGAPVGARFIGPDAAAYGVSAAGIVGRSSVGASVLLGAFGDEYLLLSQGGRASGVPGVAGTGSPSAAPFVALTGEATLLGEELYTAGPLLGGTPGQLATLLAQDGIRLFAIAVIVFAAIARTLGLL